MDEAEPKSHLLKPLSNKRLVGVAAFQLITPQAPVVMTPCPKTPLPLLILYPLSNPPPLQE